MNRCPICGRFIKKEALDRLKAEASDRLVTPAKRKMHTPMSHKDWPTEEDEGEET